MNVNSNASTKTKGRKRPSKQSEQKITALKFAGDNLLESQATLDTIVNSTSDMIWAVDSTNFGILWSNQSFQNYFLQQRLIEIKPGMRAEDLFPTQDYIQLWTALFQRALAEGPYATEYQAYTGATLFQLSFNLLKKDGETFGISVFGKDITERKRAEAALRESEQRFREMFESHSAVMLLIEPDSGAIMDANAAALEFYGYSRDQLTHLFTHDINMLSPLEAAEARQKTKSKQRDRWIFPHRLANGGIRTVEVHSSPITVNGQLLLFSIIQDVTERQSAHEQLEFLKQSIDTALDPAFWMDRNGRFVYVNEAACKSLGYTRGELLQMQVSDVAPRVTPERWHQIWKQLKENKNGFSESVHRRKDGSEFPVDVTSTYVQFEGQEYCNGFAKDITERKEAEEKLRQSEALYRQAIEVSGAVPYLQSYEAAGTHVLYDFIGEGIRQITGYGPEEFSSELFDSLTLKRILVEELTEYSWLEAVQRVRSGEYSTWKCEHCIRARNGEIRWVSEAAVELRDENGVSHGSIGLFQDITQRKQSEEELQKLNALLEERVAERTMELHHMNAELERANHAKDEFLATMSHELRTPLNSVLGLSESLLEQRRGSLNESQQRSLQIIASSGNHLLELINDILDLSKIEAGKFDCYPEFITINDICTSSLTFVKNQASKKSITIFYKNEATVPLICADPRRLKQILVNLLTNAVKFTPEHGQITLQVRSDVEHGLIQFSVLDNGIGIAPQDLKRLFQPFVQVSSGNSRQYEGTGLGLALVQKLTDLHGGSVQVESEVGKGSRFSINLPWAKEMFPQQSTSPGNGPLTTTIVENKQISFEEHPRHGSILLAEDSMPNILTIGKYLESHGYEIVVAHNGVEALEQAERANPDIILMDVQMPAMDGLEATRRLRANSRFAATPIIALTALAMPGDRERCLQAGASEYMSKPVSLKSLVNMIDDLLGHENT